MPLPYFFLLSFSLLLGGCGSNVRKANKLIETGAYDQAIGLLDKEIQSDPRNKEAHLAMGNCFATKYCHGRIEGRQKYDLVEAREKALDYYRSALQIDPQYVSAYYNLGDFLSHIGKEQEAKDCFNRVVEINDDNIGALTYLDRNESVTACLKRFLRSISNNKPFQIVLQQNRGTCIIIADSCELSLICDGKSDDKVKCLKYEVFRADSAADDSVTLLYDIVEKLDKEEFFYTAGVWSWVNYMHKGWTEVEYDPKDLGYKSRLYRRTLSKSEASLFTDRKNMHRLLVLDYLFNDNMRSYNALDQNDKSAIAGPLQFVERKDYRKIDNIGHPIVFKISELGFSQKPGSIRFQKVRAQKFIKDAKRYATLPKDDVVFGSGSIHGDTEMVRTILSEDLLAMPQRDLLLAGKAHKGTPKRMILTIWRDTFELKKKHYSSEACYEYWKNKKTDGGMVFNNSLLDDYR